MAPLNITPNVSEFQRAALAETHPPIYFRLLEVMKRHGITAAAPAEDTPKPVRKKAKLTDELESVLTRFRGNFVVI